MKALVLSFLLGLSGLEAAHLPPKRKPRPVPIEPDAVNHGPFHAPVLPPSARVEEPWRPDAQGFYWVVAPNGTRYGDLNRAVVLPFGKPVSQ